MRRNFWKATLVSLGAYAGALLTGFMGDFRFTLFAVLALQVTWTLFCSIRLAQLRLSGAHKPHAAPDERDGYGFAAGGLVSSISLLAVIVVLTQAV
jgi:hypothetical protein